MFKMLKTPIHMKKVVSLGVAFAMCFSIQRSVETNAQARSTTDWISEQSKVIAGDYNTTHYMETYRQETMDKEYWRTKTLHQGSHSYTSHGYSVMQYVTIKGNVAASTGRVKAEYGDWAYVSDAILYEDGLLHRHQAYCGIDMNN